MNLDHLMTTRAVVATSRSNDLTDEIVRKLAAPMMSRSGAIDSSNRSVNEHWL